MLLIKCGYSEEFKYKKCLSFLILASVIIPRVSFDAFCEKKEMFIVPRISEKKTIILRGVSKHLTLCVLCGLSDIM